MKTTKEQIQFKREDSVEIEKIKYCYSSHPIKLLYKTGIEMKVREFYKVDEPFLDQQSKMYGIIANVLVVDLEEPFNAETTISDYIYYELLDNNDNKNDKRGYTGFYVNTKENLFMVYFIPIADIENGTKKEYNEKYRLLTIWLD